MRLAYCLAGCLTLACLSCDSGYNTSALLIQGIENPSGTSNLQVALSANPDFLGGYKEYTATYNTVAGGSLTFSDISWTAKDPDQTEAEFWLLIAEDTDTSNSINDGDLILPAMRVVLRASETTTIESIRFNHSATPAAVATAAFASTPHAFRISVDKNLVISPSSPLRLVLGSSLSIPITDPMLASGLVLRTAEVDGFAFIDADNDGTYTTGTEYASHAAAVPLSDNNIWIIYTLNP
ncbi:MAG: hypothetical protein KBB32_09130 [Spirochaetia bacterium]|nr:hypothetical protein [Spirochaetia bacterium]